MKSLPRLLSCLAIVVGAGFLLYAGSRVSGQRDKGWKVWVKTSPCSGRHDWVSVAREDPAYGGGGGTWSNADLILAGTGMHCVRNIDESCSFAEATAEAAMVRASSKFSNYCCRDYSVWENNQTGKLSIVAGKFGTAGFGWRFRQGNLCCEEAEAIAGILGACSSSRGESAENSCSAEDQQYSVWENSQTGKRSVVLGKFGTAGFGWRLTKAGLCCAEAETLAGIPGACSGSTGSTGHVSFQATDNQASFQGDTLTYYAGTTPEKCQVDCDANPKCKAFTFIRRGAYSPNAAPMCYLISRVTAAAASTCCVSSMKKGVRVEGVDQRAAGPIHKPSKREDGNAEVEEAPAETHPTILRRA
jgi:hypothetical protein